MSAITATFPSEDLPTIPGFVFDVPDGWSVADYAGSLAALTSPASSDDLWVNVQIRHSRVDGGVTLEAAALATWVTFRAMFPDSDKDMEREGMYGGKVCYLRSAYLNVPDADSKLMRLEALFLAPPGVNRSTVDLFHVVGTVDEARVVDFTEGFLAITKSLTFTD